jgi:molybdenum cofactor cytidylyltransferase
MAEPSRCALLILAAGASTRMGRAKQLLPVNDQPLLRRVAQAALSAPASPVLVVLGAHAAEIAPCLEGLPVRIVVHAGWAEGMGSSVRAGMEALASCQPAPESVVIALGDQPDFSASHLARLIEAWCVTGQPIVASEQGTVRGPPVLFAAKYFPALRTLQGDAGARSLLQAHAHEVTTVPLQVAPDLDTPADYAAYLNRKPPAKA